MTPLAQDNAIRSTVQKVLGEDRVVSVKTRSSVNDDGVRILRVEVVYDAQRPLSVDEMDRIVDEAWSTQALDQPTPIFDFREDTDRGFVPAE